MPSARAVSGSGVNSSDHAANALDTSSDTPVIINPPSSAAAGTVACASGSPPDSRSSTCRSPVANQSSSATPAASTGSPMPAAACSPAVVEPLEDGGVRHAWLVDADQVGQRQPDDKQRDRSGARPSRALKSS